MRADTEAGMGLTYSIEVEQRLARLQYEGETCFAAWREAMLAMLEDVAFEPGMNILADRRRSATASAEFVHAVVNFLAENAASFEGARWATIVSSPAAYGMSRMAQTLASDLPFPLRVFTEESDALAWLAGLDPE